MKTLLIPTNFTDLARHATDYALKLYGKEKLTLILLNTYEQPKTGRSIQLSIVDIMKKNSEKGLTEDKKRIEENYKDLDFKIDLRSCQGSVSSSIKSALKKEKIDLIVMGSKGDRELMDIFVESETAKVVKSINHPMLIVPPIAKFTSLDNIILTTDQKPITNEEILKELKSLSMAFGCQVRVLNINKSEIEPNKEIENQISSYLQGVKHDFSYRKHFDIPTGIFKFIKETDADMVTLIKRRGGGSLVQRLFHQSVSRRIVKHVRQALLLFTDQNY